MASIDRRLRLWAWLIRRQGSIAHRSEAAVIAMQRRRAPDNAVLNFILGTLRPGAEVSERAIPGPAGDLAIRIYRPVDSGQGSRPLILYFHGGGFVLGEMRLGDWLCSNVAVNVGAVVVSADYRLAPRHRFPAAVDDSYAALRWAAENAAELGADGPVGVMGESAGANLSAVICLLARDRRGPAISHQALLYPPTDMTAVPPATAGTAFLSETEMRAYRALYLGDADPSDPRASPLLASDHGGLPPALILVGEHDPLRGNGIRYAEALRDAGVPVRLTEYVGMPHGFLNFPGLCRIASQAVAEICAEQKAALIRHPAAVPAAGPDGEGLTNRQRSPDGTDDGGDPGIRNGHLGRGPRGSGPRGSGRGSPGPRGLGPRGSGPRGSGPRGSGPRGVRPRPLKIGVIMPTAYRAASPPFR